MVVRLIPQLLGLHQFKRLTKSPCWVTPALMTAKSIL